MCIPCARITDASIVCERVCAHMHIYTVSGAVSFHMVLSFFLALAHFLHRLFSPSCVCAHCFAVQLIHSTFAAADIHIYISIYSLIFELKSIYSHCGIFKPDGFFNQIFISIYSSKCASLPFSTCSIVDTLSCEL